MDEEEIRAEVSNDQSFYAEPSEITKYQLGEISHALQAFAEIGKLERALRNALEATGIERSRFGDFHFGVMTNLENLRSSLPIKTFLERTFLGCVDAMMCLEVIAEDPRFTTTCRRFIWYIQNALSVIAHILRSQGWTVPDVGNERMLYQEIIDGLRPLTETYLREQSDYDRLEPYAELIMNFQVVEELEHGLNWLKEVLEEVRNNFFGIVRRRENTLFELEHWNFISNW